jgi:hypothetical protein
LGLYLGTNAPKFLILVFYIDIIVFISVADPDPYPNPIFLRAW